MTTIDSDAENPHRSGTWSHRNPRRLRLIGTQSTHVDPSAVESSRGGHRFAGLSDESEEPMEDVPTGGVGEGQDLSASDTESINGISDVEGEDIREPMAPTEPVGVDFRGRPPVRAFASLDSVNLVEVFSRRAHVMRAVPMVFRGEFRSALRFAMQEIVDGARSEDPVRCTRAWKLFFLLPRMLLFRPVRRGLVPRTKLEERFRQFQSGDWTSLLLETAAVSEEAHSRSVRRRRRDTKDNEAKRVAWAMARVQLGELSAARQALEEAAVAPGTLATLAELTNRGFRPRVPRQPINEDIMRKVPGEQFQLDPDEFLIGLRKARRGAAAGPSDLFRILESAADSLCKPDGGVREIVVGMVTKSWLSKTPLVNLAFAQAFDSCRFVGKKNFWTFHHVAAECHCCKTRYKFERFVFAVLSSDTFATCLYVLGEGGGSIRWVSSWWHQSATSP